MSNTQKLLGTKIKIKTHPLIDYFEPLFNEEHKSLINPLNALMLGVNKVGGGVIHGAQGLKKMIKREAPTITNTDIRYDELGYVNFTGFVSKRQGRFDRFHQRFAVIRGFDLYWFRVDLSAKSGEFKQKCTLPSLPTNFDTIIKDQKCFVVEK